MTGITLEIGLTFGIIIGAMVLYASEKLAMELTSLIVLTCFLLLSNFTTVEGLNTASVLAGFADPALITVLALLIVGEGIVRTEALTPLIRKLASLRRKRTGFAIAIPLVMVMFFSAFLNNTPMVVIFIPIMKAIADRMSISTSNVMIPLSYVAILGGMTTLIGSSTNLLVASSAANLGLPDIGFFDFIIPGSLLAGIGLIFAVFVVPKILPVRRSLSDEFVGSGGKHFIAELHIGKGSALLGHKAVAGMFKALPDMTVRLIQRDEEALLPPYDGIRLESGDTVIVAATREALTNLVHMPEFWDTSVDGVARTDGKKDPVNIGVDEVMAEVVISPNSRFIGRTLEQVQFHARTNVFVLGLQRRARMIRRRLNEIELQAGDVLLVLSNDRNIKRLRSNTDVLLMEWSAHEIPSRSKANIAGGIFAGMVLCAGFGLLPIAALAVLAATLMIGLGCLRLEQALRAVDGKIALLVGTALAMGHALQTTGGADLLAHSLLSVLDGAGPAVILSALFALIAFLTNILSNNATAVLFTPIAVGMANELGVEPMVFVYAVIFAANCSFATPMGYQTNLLVMVPGHYQFTDYLKAGIPLMLVLWAAFSIFAPWFYGL